MRPFRFALNPILLKELRQSVRSRFVSVSYCLFLLLLVVVTGFVVWIGATEIHRDPGAMFGTGRTLFQALFVPLSIVCMLFVPSYAGIRMAVERGDQHLDLQFVTRLTPGSILRGKLLAACSLIILMASAALPFLTLTFRLGGIDLPSAFVILAMLPMAGAFATVFALTLATLPGSRVWRVILGLIGGIVLFVWMIMLNTSAFGMVEFGVGSRIATAEFWRGTLFFFLGGVTLGGLLFSLATARMSPPAANRALPVRLWGAGSWVATGLIFATIAFVEHDEDYLIPWLVFSFFLSMAGMAIAMGERPDFGRRVRRAIPRRRLWRLLAFPFFNGAAPGMLWSVIIGVAAMALGGMAGNALSPGGYDSQGIDVMVGLLAYAFAYCQTGMWLWHFVARKKLARGYAWLLALMLLMLGVVTPILVGLADGSLGRDGYGAWTVGNPFALFDDKHRFEGLLFVAIWCMVLLAPWLFWTFKAWRAFQPLDTSKPEQP